MTTETDLFDVLRISALTQEEKIELIHTRKHLDLLCKDQDMSVRIRARMMSADVDYEEEKRLAQERDALANLMRDVESTDFSTRVQAKAKLRKHRENI